MKAMSKISIGLVATALLMVGCGGAESTKTTPAVAAPVQAAQMSKPAADVTEASLGLRKTNLYTEDCTSAQKTEYRTAAAGSSAKMARAFQDAPPMIPHDTTGMLPIKIGNNQCVSCHTPPGIMGATPIPESHFTDFRPHHKMVNGTFVKVVDNYKNDVAIRKTEHLQGARFNCSQCHAPQSQGNLAVENTFEAQYTSKDGASHSSWTGGKLTDGLQTLHGGDNFVTDADVKNENSPAGHLPGEH